MSYMRGPILRHRSELVKKKAKQQIDWNSKRGTWVQIVSAVDDLNLRKFEGIHAVVLEQLDERQVLIQFDHRMEGLHNGNGRGAEDRCWFIHPKYLMIISASERAKRQGLRPRNAESSYEQVKKVKATLKKWKRGARVRVKKGVGWDRYVGINAYVLEQRPEDEGVLIQFDQEMHGLHDGDGVGQVNRCLWVESRQIMSYWEPQQKTKTARVEAELPKSVYAKLPRSVRAVFSEDAPDEPPDFEEALRARLSDSEEELLEEAEIESPRNLKLSQFAEQYLSGGEDAVIKTAWKAKPLRLRLDTGDLCRVRKSDGSKTAVDDMPARVIATGPFTRFLLQFDYRISGGHSGKGKGEPGRCKWFYEKDIVPITLGDAALMDRQIRDRQKIRSSKKKQTAKVAGKWAPNPIAKTMIGERDSSSDSMWNVEEVPAPKKTVKARLPSITTSGKLTRGCKVVVAIAPADNKGLRGKQGTIVSDSGGGNNVTVEFDKDIIGGHCGTGAGRSGRCWNIGKALLKPIDVNVVFYIKEDYKRGGKNLKGMEVKILANITHPASEGSSVVEFTEEIPKGHSADGKGKKAHCLTVPVNIIGKKKKEEPKRVKMPHEVKAIKEAKKK